MKWIIIILVGLAVVFSGLIMLQKHNLPQISLPKLAQHNTIGELPFVEVWDDGDFYEYDGEENDACWEYARLEHGDIVKSVNDWVDDYLKDKSVWEKISWRIKLFIERLDWRIKDKIIEKYHSDCLKNNKYIKDLRNDDSPTAEWMVFHIDQCGSWCCSEKDPSKKCSFDVEEPE